MATGLIFDPIYKRHDTGRGHPECPERCDAVRKGIAHAVGQKDVAALHARDAADTELGYVHTAEYIATARRDIEQNRGVLSTGDTAISKESLAVAIRAVGGCLVAVDTVMAGKVENAFCGVRPPGHHATSDQGMGFCVFNNGAIAARYAQKQHGIERVLIVDWDVHHGNGTQDIFYEDPSVFYFSTHQFPCYPGTGRAHETGKGAGKGFTINCPVAPGSGRKEIVDAFTGQLLPAMKTFKPQFVIVSAGFDARVGDPIGNLWLTDQDFSDLTYMIKQVATETANGRMVSVLEGGYNLGGLASAAGAHVRALCDSAKG